MKSNQKGFSGLEILVITFIVGLIGVVGWLVYDRQKNKTDSKSTTAQTSQQAQQESLNQETKITDQYEGWITYNDSNYGVSFKHPVNWNVSKSEKNGFLIITTSQITSAEIEANQDSLSKYNEDMKVNISVSKTKIEGGTSNTSNVLESVNFNDTEYSLLAQHNLDKPVIVSLTLCSSANYCSGWISGSNGKYLSASIVSVANQGDEGDFTVPINLKSNKYKTANLVLKSLEF